MTLLETLDQLDEKFYNIPYNHVISTAVYFISALLLIWLSRFVFKLFHRKVNMNDELVEQDNVAFAIANTGYFVGVLLCAGGTLLGESEGLIFDVINIFIYGSIGILTLNVGMLLNDLIILNKFKVYEEIIENRNVSVGIVVAANYIAIGFIILGALVGEGGNGLVTASIWIVGQILLFCTTFLYDLITPYKIYVHLKKQNIAVGIGFAGAIIAIGNLIYFSLQENYEDPLQFGTNIAIYTGIGVLLLPVVRYLSDKILLPGQNLTDEIVNQENPNLGAAFLEAFSYIGGSVLISWCL